MDLSIQNVINILLALNPQGLANYNTSTIAYFTHEPYADGYMDKGYESVILSTDVANIFGTNSLASKVASVVFSQQKNIRSGNGSLVLVPFLAPTQIISMDNIPDAGTIELSYDGGTAVVFSVGDLTDSDAMTAKLRTIEGLGNVKASISTDGLQIAIDFIGFEEAPVLIATANNSLESSSTPVSFGVAQGRGVETLLEAVTRTNNQFAYFGVLHQKMADETTLQAEATYIQSLRKMYFPVHSDKTFLEEGEIFDTIRSLGLNQTRCLVNTISEENAILYAAAYASRGLSTNFNGSNTTQTQHLKDMVGVLVDTGLDQGDIDTCKVTGVDVYVSIQGVNKLFTSKGNVFFDRVYNRLWLVGAMEVAGFNVLATTSTKIPQTEEGVDTLSGAYREICKTSVKNGFVAPGTWTGPDTFGDPEDFRRNIEEFGYFIYNTPVALQDVSEREDRKAPLIQIAIKEAGAIHSSDVIININA